MKHVQQCRKNKQLYY